MPIPLPSSTRRMPRSRIQAGSAPYVGREAIRAQFASVLTSPRRTELLRVAIVGNEVALLFRATSGDGTSTEVFDVMSCQPTFSYRIVSIIMMPPGGL